ncbi:Tet(A)/Tet(B)/Tet(C) family tetracycline efflux MFS transporter [Luteibacter anthropi]|uniref:Tet(A)/Tet(B)/Tet(C) family tetracycline efflux MFS transporter n=1 Tax=Luteibacter anthropi TaxID=564369 RepID=A0A7X5UC64_9GAMM|nr:Tet(A)/Tet(B)/Tet(C) family tetracycline efflux MFS transporter [Luteibacter anthropi]NII07768.1 Tet(A)/Tet(B)/Tet(C) family tetracycline efflux MFS transporter [Luteibacter anthropi]URX61062.1 Tet(A)/Tet(B)/Tet(C) family tetracycline efflux MFS transporter [Luteibacter anthropi]
MRFAFPVILAAILLDAIGLGLVMPILPGLLRTLTSADLRTFHYGGLMAAYALMQFLCAPVLGALSDRFGRRPVLLVSMAGAAADYVLMALAPSLGWLYAGRLLAGATGANMAVATALLTDITAPGLRAKRFGQLGAMFGIGFIAGPVLGGLLGDWHLRAPFVAAAILNGANALFAYFLLPESRPAESRPRLSLKAMNPFTTLHRLAGGPMLVQLVTVFALLALVSQIPATLWILYGQDRLGWSLSVAGLSLAGYGACHALAQAFGTGAIVERFGERRALLTGLAADALGMLLISFATRSWIPFVLLPLFAAGGMALPALQAMLSREVDQARQGELQGMLASVASLMGIVGPLVVSTSYALTRTTWPGATWVFGAMFYVLVGALMAWQARRPLATA